MLVSTVFFRQRPSLWLFVLLFFILKTPVKAQTIFPINASDSISTCSGIFTDNGGVDADNTGSGSDTITICSNSSAVNASHIRLTFTEFVISGELEVYNGPEVDTATLVNILGDGSNNTNPVIEASAANGSGCLTLVYTSAGASPGWQALISCVRACQPVIADLVASNPLVVPSDTGYIDVCIGEVIDFTGAGIYPESGFIYDQSDENSSFSWSFADGSTASGPEASHAYTQAGGYIVQLLVTDQNGCSSNNQISQRIRVAPKPNFNIQVDVPSVICVGDTFELGGSTQFNPSSVSNLFVTTAEQSFAARQILADTTFLPDGSGVEYTTSLEFNSFAPGQIVTNVADIEAICLNMEHSYAGDLDISIECPNGQELFMVRFGDLAGQFVGEAIDLDDLQQGVGYDYCWTASASQTWVEAVESIPVFSGTSIPAGNYRPEDSMDNLIGCPLNGEWTIRVKDNLSIDNGWIFSWGISFADYLFPDLERFTVGFEEAAWRPSNDLLFYSPDSISAAPVAAGQASYVYSITDDFGCVNDTTVQVEILPFSHPDCYDCQPMLDNTNQVVNTAPGTLVPTTLASQSSIDTTVLFEAKPNVSFGNALYPSLGSSYRNTLNVNSIFPATITDITQLQSICVNINTENVGGVRLFVMPPNGAFFELSTANGGTGANYTNTCFSPSAATSISEASPPFTGDFLPEGNLNNLVGTPINGDWTLIVYHVGIGTPLGEVLDWSITFTHENPLSYSWTPDDGSLSCIDCPNPMLTVAASNTTYQVLVTDAYACTETGTLNVNTNTVNLDLEFVVLDVDCPAADNGSITAEVSNGTAPYSFLWNTGDTTATINNLPAGSYMVTVTDADGNTIEGDTTITEPDTLLISLSSQTNLSCAGDASGALAVAINGGTLPYTLAWSNGMDSSSISGLDAGDYTLVVTDANGCETQQTYTIEEPLALEASAIVQGIICGASSDTAAIDVTVSGGSTPYSFVWSNGEETEDISGLPMGDYSLTITDANGCTFELSTTVSESNAIVLSATTTNVSCFGEENGAIDLSVEDGTAPFVFAWSNGQDTEDIDSLAVGEYTVTLIDAAGCTASLTSEITQPDSLNISSLLTDVACSGEATGRIDITVSGGTPPASFLWSNGATTEDLEDLLAGNYTLTLTDVNGCTTSASFPISEPAALILNTTTTDVSCSGDNSGEVMLSVEGGLAPYTYLWSNGSTDANLSGLAEGTYSVVVTDANNCSASLDNIQINESAALSCEVSIIQEAINNNDGALSAAINGGTAPYEIEWSNGATSLNITDLVPGTYTLTVTDANACTTTCAVTLNAYAAVGDFVFFDMNRDGIQNIGEGGIAGVTVVITSTDGSFMDTQQTDGLGRYLFRVLPGNYWINFGQPQGLVASPQNQGNDPALDSDIDPISLRTALVSLAAFDENLDIDAGFYDPCGAGLIGAGMIGFSQEVCGPGNSPDLLIETSPITGTLDGVIEYMWMRKTGNPMDTPINNWTPIPNSNSVNYQPGPVSETTYFARCVRIDNCPFRESNFVEVTVGDDAFAQIEGPALVCVNEALTYVAMGAASSATIEWNFGANTPNIIAQTANSITVSWPSFGQSVVSLSVADNNCTSTDQINVNVSANPSNCANVSTTIGSNSRAWGNTGSLAYGQALLSTVYPNPTAVGAPVVLELLEGYSTELPMYLEAYDATGKKLARQELQNVSGRIQLDLFKQQPPGLYLLRLQQGEYAETHRLILK